MMTKAFRLLAAVAAIGIATVGVLSEASAQTRPHGYSARHGYIGRSYTPPAGYPDYSNFGYSYGGSGNRGGCSDSPAEC
jgi:hypothetical protein